MLLFSNLKYLLAEFQTGIEMYKVMRIFCLQIEGTKITLYK